MTSLDLRDRTPEPPAMLDPRMILLVRKWMRNPPDRSGPCPCGSGSCREGIPASQGPAASEH